MKAIVGLLAIVLLLAVVGWITFSFTNDNASVNINTEKMRQDTEVITEKGKKLVHDVGTTLEGAADDDSSDPVEANVDSRETDVERNPTGIEEK